MAFQSSSAQHRSPAPASALCPICAGKLRDPIAGIQQRRTLRMQTALREWGRGRGWIVSGRGNLGLACLQCSLARDEAPKHRTKPRIVPRDVAIAFRIRITLSEEPRMGRQTRVSKELPAAPPSDQLFVASSFLTRQRGSEVRCQNTPENHGLV